MNFYRAFTILALSSLTACGGGGNSSSNNVIDVGNVAFWTFDNMTGPIAPNTKFEGADALLNMASIVPGRIGNGVRFDASLEQSYVEISGFMGSMDNSYIIANFPEGRISLSMWLKPDQIENQSNYQIFGGGYYGSQSFVVRLHNGKLAFSLFSPADGSYVLISESSSSLNVGTWLHVAITYDGNNARIYLNGALDNSHNVSVTVPPLLNNIYVGGLPKNSSFGVTTFPGVIDEVFMSATTLTQSEVNQLAFGISP